MPEIAGNQAARRAWNYPLFDAIFNRRSRRMSLGAEIPGGATKYKSDKPPLPLDEIEEAMLVQAGTGISGMNLSDLPYADSAGKSTSGNTMIQFTGRTWASPCGSHGTELIYFNDSGAYIVSYKDVTTDKLRQYETEGDREAIVNQFRANRTKILDGRPQHQRAYPDMLSFNIWDSNIEGSTVFLPVINNTWQYINGLLLVCGWADGGALIVDDLSGEMKPAGCERWVAEGLLKADRPLALSLSSFGQEVEPAFILQNLALAEQAMGLGGWIHAAVSPLAMATALGFRTVETPAMPVALPVGIDGVLEAYCPPYYESMDAAVDAVVAAKFGPNGIYTLDAATKAPFLDRNEFVAAVPRYSERLVQCVKDICNYIYNTYGRFPFPAPAMTISNVWCQAHHLDLDFYDRFYGAEAYTETQANHYVDWHGDARPWERVRARELAGARA